MKGFPRSEFVKTRARNEALDVRCYALSAYSALNTNINKIAERIRLRAEQLKDDDKAIDAPKPEVRKPRRRKARGYVSAVRT